MLASADAPMDGSPRSREDLEAELEALRAERDRTAALEEAIMDLLHCKSPDLILHDLRNVLNDVTMLKALLDRLQRGSHETSEGHQRSGA